MIFISRKIKKLEHEEAKLFLQLIWSALLSFLGSLIIGTFTKQIDFNQKNTFSIAIVAISGGIILTWVVFGKKFNKIKNKIKYVRT